MHQLDDIEYGSTEDYCFVCKRATDHRGEHDLDQVARWRASKPFVLSNRPPVVIMTEECFAEFGPHSGHDDCARMLAEMAGEGVEQPEHYNERDEFGQMSFVI